MIAVTGANGLLGSFIIRKLLEENRPCVGIKRKDSDTHLLDDIAKNITWRNADILDPVGIEDALDGVTDVVHAAAFVSFNPNQRRKIIEANTIGTRNVVNAALARNVRRFIHISSVAALGRQKDQKIITEDNKWTSSNINSVYAESKYEAELEIFRAQEEGISTVILNPSVILAPADWDKSSAKLFKYVWSERPFYIDGSMNYVDVRDIAHIVSVLLDSPIQGQRFILNAGSIPFKTFFSEIAARFNKKAPSIKLTRSALRAISFVEGVRTRFTSTEPLITRETAKLAGTHFSYNSGKIKETFGFTFTPLNETLDWCCDYYLNYRDKK